MATKTINVDVLAKMFLAGAQNIEAKKDYINELNVFPVPDGDSPWREINTPSIPEDTRRICCHNVNILSVDWFVAFSITESWSL